MKTLKTISELIDSCRSAQLQVLPAETVTVTDAEAERMQQLLEKIERQNAKEVPASDGLPECPVCKNKRLIYVLEQGIEKIKLCECRKQADKSTAAGMLKAKLDSYTYKSFLCSQEWQRKLKTLCSDWQQKTDSKMLLICGQSGCGKTHIAAAAAKARAAAFTAGKYEFFYWSSDIRDLKNLQINDYPNFSAKLEKLKTCPLLFLDGVFDTKPTDADLAILDELLFFRSVSGNVGTIITSRKSVPAIASAAPSVFARLQAACGQYIINLKKAPERNFYASQAQEF